MVFVDGDHSYAAVLTDIRAATALIKDGGLLCGDDLERQIFEIDEVYARTQIESDYIRDPRSGQEYHPGVTLAVERLFGEVSQVAGCWAVRKARHGLGARRYVGVHCSGGANSRSFDSPQLHGQPDFQRWRQDRRKTVTVPVNPGTQAACEQSEPSRHESDCHERKPRAVDSARFSKLGHRSALDL